MAASEAGAVLATWEAVRDELRRQRGRNGFRGVEEHLLPRKEIRLRRENRGGHPPVGWVSIHLSPKLDDLWAENPVTGDQWRIEAFGGRLAEWLSAVLEHVRGAAYLHTNSDKADYRKAIAIPVTGQEGGKNETI